MAGGTGQKFTTVVTTTAGAASAIATLLSVISIYLQTKNYRKPLLQRYVVRILLMVPLFSISSLASMVSQSAAAFLNPIRDIYEAFTIYTFFQLLINYLGGERALIIMTHGRQPANHLWPLDHVLPKVDISDPHTFLAIKRGILQYAWLKPLLSLATIVMKATDTYQEGYIGLSSGYLWSGILYNISVTLSLYSLGLFWVCMHHDLKPFRPMPKFLCVKLIIFASYWQGFMLSILVWIGVIPDDVRGYTPDNLAAAFQDFLLCIEMPAFAIAHWYAFSWHDFADKRVQAVRMPIWYAFRDAFGVGDLIQDTKETLRGDKYDYRIFDSGDKIMAHEDSRSRLARLKDGMRYERGGKGKYWIPRREEINQTTPLLGQQNGGPSHQDDPESAHYNAEEELILDPDEEILYAKARKLEFGDWNYPVITANEPTRENFTSPHPSLYQNTRTGGSLYRRPSDHSDVTRSTPPPERRRKSAPEAEGSQASKRKAESGSSRRKSGASHAKHGQDPLEIAYGPIVGTNPQITEDDFEVDTEQGSHKAHEYGESRPRPVRPECYGDDDASTGAEASRPWGRHDGLDERSGYFAGANQLGDEDVWKK